VITDGTLRSQRTIYARPDTVAGAAATVGIRPPAVIVVGEVVTIGERIAGLRGALPPDGSLVPVSRVR